MTLAGLVLVLTAAVCHAGWNLLVKRLNAGPELVWLFSVLALAIWTPVVAWFGLGGLSRMSGLELFAIVSSVLLHLGYFLLLQTGYRKGDLSLVYPTARASGPVLSVSFAAIFLGERVTPQIALGGAIVVLGVLMLTGGFRRDRRAHAGASLGFGLAAGLFIGSYTAWDAWTVATLAVSPLLLDYATHLGRATLLAPIAWRRRENVRTLWTQHRAAVLAIAILCPMAYVLVLYAMTFTPVAYVAPVRETSVLLSVLAGSLLLGEGDLPRRLIWAVVCLTGVVILALA